MQNKGEQFGQFYCLVAELKFKEFAELLWVNEDIAAIWKT